MQRRKYYDRQHARPNDESGYENHNRSNLLSIYRPLDEEQARDIRSTLHGIVKTPAVTVLRGESGTKTPRLTIVGVNESRSWGFLRIYNRDEVRSKITENVPSLDQAIDVRVLNIGRFGIGKSKVSIAAALDLPDSANNERGSIQGVLCELNQWEPVPMYRTYRAHLTLAELPGDTPDDVVMNYKRSVAEVIEPGTALTLGAADIRA